MSQNQRLHSQEVALQLPLERGIPRLRTGTMEGQEHRLGGRGGVFIKSAGIRMPSRRPGAQVGAGQARFVETSGT